MMFKKREFRPGPVSLVALSIVGICYLNNFQGVKLFPEVKEEIGQKLSRQKKPNIELTLRFTLRDDILELLFCDFLRSTALFWSPHFGDVVFILDEEDKAKNFELKLHSISLPNKFRFVYEKDLKERSYIEKIGPPSCVKRGRRCWYGKLRMFYSSFIMDEYTKEDTVIAWTDTDTIFTFPVTSDTIFRNGKLIVKGINKFQLSKTDTITPEEKNAHIWNATTYFAIGFPMVSDFMAYFPAFVYARTIRNCRHHIMYRLRASTFEEAFIKMVENDPWFSPVNIVLSYAYYFERELYDWHIDIGNETLESYNKRVLPPKYPLRQSDITPEVQLTIHSKYFALQALEDEVLEQAICYSQIALKMTHIPHCDKFRNEINLQLFEFQDSKSHVNTWCKPGRRREKCGELIDERYEMWAQQYRKGELKINTSYIQIIDDFARTQYDKECYDLNYQPYT